eukprot:3467801-Prorocentrum_lima.AAC.1
MESWRPEQAKDAGQLYYNKEGKVCGIKGRRVCPWCELDLRRREWPEMSEEKRTENPDYCVWDQ